MLPSVSRKYYLSTLFLSISTSSVGSKPQRVDGPVCTSVLGGMGDYSYSAL